MTRPRRSALANAEVGVSIQGWQARETPDARLIKPSASKRLPRVWQALIRATCPARMDTPSSWLPIPSYPGARISPRSPIWRSKIATNPRRVHHDGVARLRARCRAAAKVAVDRIRLASSEEKYGNRRRGSRPGRHESVCRFLESPRHEDAVGPVFRRC